MYIDGVAVKTFADTYDYTALTTQIGRVSTDYSNGIISSLYGWGRVLTADEIALLNSIL